MSIEIALKTLAIISSIAWVVVWIYFEIKWRKNKEE